MIRRFAVAAAAALCLSAGNVHAAARTPPDAVTAEQWRVAERYMAEVVSWVAGFTRVRDEWGGGHVTLLAAGETAHDFARRRDRRGGRAWLDAFVRENEAAQEALIARLDAHADKAPSPPVEHEDIRRTLERAERLKVELRRVLVSSAEVRKAYYRALERVIRGEDRDGSLEWAAATGVRTALIRAEMVLLDYTASTGSPDLPGGHADRALWAVFAALLVMIEAEVEEAAGRPFDPAARAAEVLAYADTADRALAAMETALPRVRAVADSQGTPTLRRKLHEVADTWEEALGVHRDLARLTRESAEVLRATGSAAAAQRHEADAFDARLQALDALTRRRRTVLTD